MSSCKKCQKNVAVSDQIFCRGFCGGAFHLICAKVDSPLLDQMGLYEGNIFWMCDVCAENFANRTFPADAFRPAPVTTGAPDAMSSLQADVTELKKAILSLTTKIDKQSSQRQRTLHKPLGVGSVTSQGAKTPKRFRNGTPVVVPVTYANCARVPQTLNVTMQTVDITDEGDDELLHLYLSAFEPTTSEDDVAQLVREFLGTEDSPKVLKLVPKGKDLSTLSFVSFKVSVRPELKEAAFAHGTWPENITVREFEGRTKNVVKLSGKSVVLKPRVKTGNPNPPIEKSGTVDNMDTSSPHGGSPAAAEVPSC